MDFLSSLLKPFLPDTPAISAISAIPEENQALTHCEAFANPCEKLRFSADGSSESQEIAKNSRQSQTEKSPQPLVNKGFSQESQESQGVGSEKIADSYCWPHSPAWNGQEIALFTQRMQHLQRHGLGEPEAEATAQNLLLRDRQQDDRHLCLECRNCTSNRCKLGRPVLTVLQRCNRFKEAVKQ